MPAKKGHSLGGKCIYDWADERIGKLVCQTHGKAHTVIRSQGNDYDTLIEMYRLNMLAGKALSDARAVMDSEAWTITL